VLLAISLLGLSVFITVGGTIIVQGLKETDLSGDNRYIIIICKNLLSIKLRMSSFSCALTVHSFEMCKLDNE